MQLKQKPSSQSRGLIPDRNRSIYNDLTLQTKLFALSYCIKIHIFQEHIVTTPIFTQKYFGLFDHFPIELLKNV